MLLLALVVLGAAAAESPIRTTPTEPSSGERPHSVLLTPAQMFSFADQRQKAGDLVLAESVYRALENDPDPNLRNEARFRRSKLLVAEGKASAAAVLLRQIVDEKPEAAPARLALAQLLGRMGDTEGAWRQVRAAQATGLPPAVARLVDRYSQALRAMRPQGASLEISLAPDSNINHATRSDTLGTIFGDFAIDPQSKAKSGLGLSLHGQAFRRFGIGGDNALLLRMSSLADLYAKTRFNDIAVDVAAGPELRLARNQINLELGATQRWFGQKPFMRSVRLGASWTRPIGALTQLRLTGVAGRVDNRINDLEDGKTYLGRVEVEHALSETTGIGLNASFAREALSDPGYSTRAWRAGLLGWHDIGRATVTAEAELGRLNADDRLVLFPDKRSDHYSRLSLGVTLRQLQFHGFAPVMRFSAERNRSTIAFYDYRRRRTEFGIARAF